MHIPHLSRLSRLLLVTGIGALSTAAQAQAQWPERPVQLTVPFPAGGTVDVVGRSFAQALGAELRQAVVVVNRDGASGTIGAGVIASAAPDGYAIAFMPNGPLTVQPTLNKKLSYSLAKFRPICQVFAYPYVLAVPADSPYASLKDFMAAAKAAKKEMTYGFGGVGTAPHFAMLQTSQATDTKFLGVPFRGDPPVAMALKGGEIDAAVLTVETAAKLQFKMLAAFSEKRLPSQPALPTAKEQGLNVIASTTAGVVAPTGISADVARRLEAGCAAAVRSVEFEETMKRQNQTIDYLSADKFGAVLRADSEEKRRLIETNGLTVE